MALFKPFRGSRKSLDTQELHDGYAYFCTDDGTFHIDYVDDSGNLQRKQINANEAQKLIGYDIATVLNPSDAEIPTSKAILDKLNPLQEEIDGKVNKEGDSLINGTLSINGDLHVKGTTYTVDTETLTVNDNLIMVQGQDQAMTGIIADNGLTGMTLKAGTKIYISDFNKIITAFEKYTVAKENGDKELVILRNSGITLEVIGTNNDTGEEGTTIIENEYNNGLQYSHYTGLDGEDHTDLFFGISADIRYGAWRFVFAQNTVIDTQTKNILFDAGEIEEGSTEEVRMSIASPVLVGDTLKIGEGISTKDENGNIISFEFNEGAAQSLATREDNISNNAILAWDAEKYTIKDSGKSLDNIPNFKAGDGKNSNVQTREEGTDLNLAFGNDSFAIGKGSIATGDRAVAIGRSNKSGGNASFVIGQSNIAWNTSGTWDSATNSEVEEAGAANASFVGGRTNEIRSDASFMFGTFNTEAEKGNTNIILGQKNTINHLVRSAIIGSDMQIGKGTGIYALGVGHSYTGGEKADDTSQAMLLGFNLKATTESGKVVIGKLNTGNTENTFELGDGLGTYRHNLIESKSYFKDDCFYNSVNINANKLYLNSNQISIPNSAGQTDWLTIKDSGNHIINITANSTAGLNISNGTNPVSVISGSLDLYATKGMTFRTHGATAPSLKITSGMDNKIETGERATFIAKGSLRAMKTPTEANDVVRLGDIQKLLRLIDGLSDTQIATLNNFAKSLTEV